MFNTNHSLSIYKLGAQSEGSGSDYENRGTREVRYTDQEYEEDSSDCEDVILEVPSLPGETFKIHSIDLLK